MGLDRSQRLAVNPGELPDGLQLSPEEYFVLSRIEGKPTVAEVLATAGLPGDAALAVLEKLLQAGVIKPTEADPVPVQKKKPPSRLREKTEDRRRRNLAVHFKAPMTVERPDDLEAPGENDEDGDDVDFERVDPVLCKEGDKRIEPKAAIDIETQRWMLGLADRVSELDHFEFLGMAPTHDGRAIRRAYHETSRRLHPDAYYGRDLGSFRDLLADLFAQAKQVYAELQHVEIRNPYVDRQIEEAAHRSRLAEQKEKAQAAIDDLKRKKREEDAAKRRQERMRQRVKRQQQRIARQLEEEAESNKKLGEEEENKGNLARATNYYRLALRADPENEELREKWEACRTEARRTRAADAYGKAMNFLDIGQAAEAAVLLAEAAEADPTPEHLAWAADHIRHMDKGRAREFAMRALDALASEAAEDGSKPRKPRELAKLHVMIGRAFLAAGQKESAKQQAAAAEKLRPGDRDARALLNSIKVK